MFTQQLSFMLEAGLPLVSALEEQTENPVFQMIIHNVRNDVSSGKSFSESCAAYPRAFPNLFVSMVGAGETTTASPASTIENSLGLNVDAFH